jgi:subtilisin family serine protease
MASPHAAGVAALYLQRHPGSTPAQVAAGVAALATPGKLDGLLLYAREEGGGGGLPDKGVPVGAERLLRSKGTRLTLLDGVTPFEAVMAVPCCRSFYPEAKP